MRFKQDYTMVKLLSLHTENTTIKPSKLNIYIANLFIYYTCNKLLNK